MSEDMDNKMAEEYSRNELNVRIRTLEAENKKLNEELMEAKRLFNTQYDKNIILGRKLKESMRVPRELSEKDLVLFQKIWYSRNPIHEYNADSGEDMFWETAEMVCKDYIKELIKIKHFTTKGGNVKAISNFLKVETIKGLNVKLTSWRLKNGS